MVPSKTCSVSSLSAHCRASPSACVLRYRAQNERLDVSGSLKRVSEGMLGGLGAEIERQAEQKAKDFVDTILSSVVAQAADDLCDPDKAEDYGRFRAHLLDQLLDTPLAEAQARSGQARHGHARRYGGRDGRCHGR